MNPAKVMDLAKSLSLLEIPLCINKWDISIEEQQRVGTDKEKWSKIYTNNKKDLYGCIASRVGKIGGKVLYVQGLM